MIVKALQDADLNYDHDVDVRCIIEKPFGADLESALELQQVVEHVFREQQVYRIDHYLGKETVQNVMAFRFANFMFEPVWNRNYIDHIQITAAEDIGIGSRAGYYDQAGALRDLVQNHMLQLLTLVCMEPPASFEADKVRDEKVKVLQAITPPTPEEVRRDTVRAQYTAGVEGGEEVVGYLEEDGVPDDSRTETYAALRLEVHNWRWAGVPIFLRTGKRLTRKVTEIAVQLKPVPHLAFQSHGSVGVQPNQLVLTMQPNEGVSLSLGAKIPGSSMRIRPVNMEFLYGSAFMSQSPEAYERLILDAMRGEATLFTRNDEVIAQWSIIDPILKAWADDDEPLHTYASGSGRAGRRRRADRAAPLAGAVAMDDVWREDDTTPGAVEAALRQHVRRAPQGGARVRAGARDEHGRDRRQGLPRRDREPARARRPLPPVAAGAGRGRAGAPQRLSATVRIGTEDAPRAGSIAVGRERVELMIGERHLPKLDTIVDPLLVSGPGDDGVGAARASPRRSTRCAGWPRSC